MKPGPAPHPTALKIIRGETRPSRLNKNEPKPQLGAPTPPTWLSREARAEWRRLDKALPPGILTSADRQVMSVAAESWARWVKATRLVTELGILVQGERGVVKNPALQAARDAEATMRQCWSALGLTPSDRARLEMPEPDDDGGLESLLS
jgi:P27 family predicted phage terminase small subunit